jgi:hypothetical protein
VKKNSLYIYFKKKPTFLAPMGTTSFFVFGEGNQVGENKKDIVDSGK